MKSFGALDRRQFLKMASVGASIGPSMLAAENSTSARKGPNERITLGFIGTGTQGRGLMHNFLNQQDTQVVAVCDVDTTRREHQQLPHPVRQNEPLTN